MSQRGAHMRVALVVLVVLTVGAGLLVLPDLRRGDGTAGAVHWVEPPAALIQDRGVGPPPVPDAGKLLHDEPIRLRDGDLSGARTRLLRYRSTDGVDGRANEVTALLLTPEGAVPPGGWPLIAWAHGSVGIDPACSPSANRTVHAHPGLVRSLLRRGWAVVATDYQGLGGGGAPHRYLEPVSAAHGVVDSVVAARHAEPRVGRRWAAFGASQGGGAAWAAAEFGPVFAHGRPAAAGLVGAAAIAPSIDRTAVVDQMVDGRVDPAQQRSLVPLLLSIQRERPGFRVSDYLHGPLGQNAEALAACRRDADLQRRVSDSLTAASTRPVDSAAADRLREALRARALPRGRVGVPLYVSFGGRDTLVQPEWLVQAVARACERGAVIDLHRYPDAGHVPDGSFGPAIEFLAARFADRIAPDSCRG